MVGDGRDAGERGRVVLHVGLPKTGTTWLQALLAAHRDELRAAGVSYPALGREGMFRAAVDMRGSRERFGLTADQVAGRWAAFCGLARDETATTIFSHEILGGADEAEIVTALAPLVRREVHVVLTARDLARQATAHWQEEVKLGDTGSFADFERDQFRADRPTGPRPHFWHAQDVAAAARRWSRVVPPSRVHVVVCPPAGAAPEELWHRFAAACGLSDEAAAVVDAANRPPANTSLGVAQLALLRAVNAELGPLDRRTRALVVKRFFAERALAGPVAGAGRRPRTPAGLVEHFATVTEGWLTEIERGGYPVHGDLAELLPTAPAAEPHPDDVRPEELAAAWPAAVAEVLVELAARSGAGRRGAERPAPGAGSDRLADGGRPDRSGLGGRVRDLAGRVKGRLRG